jgi:hypothetical protein
MIINIPYKRDVNDNHYHLQAEIFRDNISMKHLRSAFLNKALSVALALGVSAGVAKAGAEHTIQFNGHDLNCATLQGYQDIPNPKARYDLTCAFIEAVEHNLSGPKLKCVDKGFDFKSLQVGTRHMDVQHKQPGIHGYMEMWSAAYRSIKSGKKVTEELEEIYPDKERARDLRLSFLVINGIKNDLEKGMELSEAKDRQQTLLSHKGYILPGTEGSLDQTLEEFIDGNPVVDGLLQCKATFPQPIWESYEVK